MKFLDYFVHFGRFCPRYIEAPPFIFSYIAHVLLRLVAPFSILYIHKQGQFCTYTNKVNFVHTQTRSILYIHKQGQFHTQTRSICTYTNKYIHKQGQFCTYTNKVNFVHTQTRSILYIHKQGQF